MSTCTRLTPRSKPSRPAPSRPPKDRLAKDRLAEAEAWVAGAREELNTLIEMVQTAPPGVETERAVMRGLAVVGAAFLQSIAARRAADAPAPARRARGRSRSA